MYGHNFCLSQIHIKHINKVCGQNVGLLSVKARGPWLFHYTPRYENVRRSRVTEPRFLNVNNTWRCRFRPHHTRGRSPPIHTVGPKVEFDLVFSDRETNFLCPVRRRYTSIRIWFNARNTARDCVSNTAVQTAHSYDVRNKHVAGWSMEINKQNSLH